MFNGEYRVYQNGQLLTTQKNLITTFGKEQITRYLAGEVSSYAAALAIGSSQTPATVSDIALGFEFARTPITLKTPIIDTGEVILSASIDTTVAGVVHEIGLFPHLAGLDEGLVGNLSLLFDQFETWTGGTYNIARTRIGNASYQVSASASATSRASVSERAFYLGGMQPNDTISLAYFVNDANADTLTVEFHTDGSNYFRYIIDPSATSGYYTIKWRKSDFVAVGAPTWDDIRYVDVLVTATAGGSTTVNFDAMRIDNSMSSAINRMVSRTVLNSPQIKLASSPLEIEYVLRYANG